MNKYRKRPGPVYEIEAFQMTKARRWDNSEWPEWLHAAWNEVSETVGAFWCYSCGPLYVGTIREGAVKVEWDDWIVQGVQGELYPCEPDIFEATYELVEEEHG